MIRLLSSLLLAGALALAAPFARADMPESGWWWNPDEPGYGFAIEVQDNYVFMVVFNYTNGGQATWHAAQGTLQSNGTVFLNDLYSARDGTCLGCSYRPSTAFLTGGEIRLEFLSEWAAEVTVGGRTIPIQRHNFRLSYGSDASELTGLWRGEWQAVLDFSNINDPQTQAFPFYGDVLVIEDTSTSSNVAYFDGCRPENSQVAQCSSAALNNHEVYGFYSPSDGTFFIIGEDDSTTFLVYEVELALNQFRGYAKRCRRSDGSNLIGLCLDNNNFPVLPVRGWRSASRAFVDGNNNAPSARPEAPAGAKSAAAAPWRDLPITVEAASDQPKRERANLAESEALLRAAVERLNARQ